MFEYEHDGAEIYRQSFATIRAEADLSRLPADVAQVAVRMVHACGQVDLVDDVAFSPAVVERAREALDAGAPVAPLRGRGPRRGRGRRRGRRTAPDGQGVRRGQPLDAGHGLRRAAGLGEVAGRRPGRRRPGRGDRLPAGRRRPPALGRV